MYIRRSVLRGMVPDEFTIRKNGAGLGRALAGVYNMCYSVMVGYIMSSGSGKSLKSELLN